MPKKNRFKKHILRIFSLVTLICFFISDIAGAYPVSAKDNSYTLAAPTVFTVDHEDTLFVLASGYLSSLLMNIENDPKNQSVTSLKNTLNKELKRIKKALPDRDKIFIPDEVIYDPVKAAILLDLGPFKMRYFNQNIPDAEFPEKNDPGNSYQIIQEKVGKYLTRQVIMRRALKGPVTRKTGNEMPVVSGGLWYNRRIEFSLPREETKERLWKILTIAGKIAANMDTGWEKYQRKGLYLNIVNLDIDRYIDALDIFFSALKDGNMSAEKLEEYALKFYSRMDENNDKFGDYDLKREKDFQKMILDIFSERDQAEIKMDPLAYAVSAFVKVVEAQAFFNGNHRMADFVMNFILLKNGLPHFMLTEKNAVRYYQLTNSIDICDGNYNIDEITEFFRTEIQKNAKPSDKKPAELVKKAVKNKTEEDIRIEKDQESRNRANKSIARAEQQIEAGRPDKAKKNYNKALGFLNQIKVPDDPDNELKRALVSKTGDTHDRVGPVKNGKSPVAKIKKKQNNGPRKGKVLFAQAVRKLLIGNAKKEPNIQKKMWEIADQINPEDIRRAKKVAPYDFLWTKAVGTWRVIFAVRDAVNILVLAIEERYGELYQKFRKNHETGYDFSEEWANATSLKDMKAARDQKQKEKSKKRPAQKKNDGPALFVDTRAGNDPALWTVREIKDDAWGEEAGYEHKALNEGLDKTVIQKGNGPIDPASGLSGFVHELLGYFYVVDKDEKIFVGEPITAQAEPDDNSDYFHKKMYVAYAEDELFDSKGKTLVSFDPKESDKWTPQFFGVSASQSEPLISRFRKVYDVFIKGDPKKKICIADLDEIVFKKTEKLAPFKPGKVLPEGGPDEIINTAYELIKEQYPDKDIYHADARKMVFKKGGAVKCSQIVDIYVFNEKDLRDNLPEKYKYLADGLITHAGTFRALGTKEPRALNLFIPYSKALALSILIETDIASEITGKRYGLREIGDARRLLSTWRDHELFHLRNREVNIDPSGDPDLKKSAKILHLLGKTFLEQDSVNIEERMGHMEDILKLENRSASIVIISGALYEGAKKYMPAFHAYVRAAAILQQTGEADLELSELLSEKAFIMLSKNYKSDLKNSTSRKIDKIIKTSMKNISDFLNLIRSEKIKSYDKALFLALRKDQILNLIFVEGMEKESREIHEYESKNEKPGIMSLIDHRNDAKVLGTQITEYRRNTLERAYFFFTITFLQYLYNAWYQDPGISNELIGKFIEITERDEILRNSESINIEVILARLYCIKGIGLFKKAPEEAVECFKKSFELGYSVGTEFFTILADNIIANSREIGSLELMLKIFDAAYEIYGETPDLNSAKNVVNNTISEISRFNETIKELYRKGEYITCLERIEREEKAFPVVISSDYVKKYKKSSKRLLALREKGINAFENGSYQQAVEYFGNVIEQNEHDPVTGKLKKDAEEAMNREKEEMDGILQIVEKAKTFFNKGCKGMNGLEQTAEEGNLALVQDDISVIRRDLETAEDMLRNVNPVGKKAEKTVEEELRKVRSKLEELDNIKLEKLLSQALARKIEKEKTGPIMAPSGTDEHLPGDTGSTLLPARKVLVNRKLGKKLIMSDEKTRALLRQLAAGGLLRGKIKPLGGVDELFRLKPDISKKGRVVFRYNSAGEIVIVDAGETDHVYSNKYLKRFGNVRTLDTLKTYELKFDDEAPNATQKAPASEAMDEDERVDWDHFNGLITEATERTGSVNITEAIDYINANPPPFSEEKIDPAKIHIYTVKDPANEPGMGMPRFKGATEPKDMIYARGKVNDTTGDLEIYVTEKYLDHLQKTDLALAEVIDHEYIEKILKKSHRVAASRAYMFVPEGKNLSPFHDLYVDDFSGQEDAKDLVRRTMEREREMPSEVQSAYGNEKAILEKVRSYEKTFFDNIKARINSSDQARTLRGINGVDLTDIMELDKYIWEIWEETLADERRKKRVEKFKPRLEIARNPGKWKELFTEDWEEDYIKEISYLSAEELAESFLETYKGHEQSFIGQNDLRRINTILTEPEDDYFEMVGIQDICSQLISVMNITKDLPGMKEEHRAAKRGLWKAYEWIYRHYDNKPKKRSYDTMISGKARQALNDKDTGGDTTAGTDEIDTGIEIEGVGEKLNGVFIQDIKGVEYELALDGDSVLRITADSGEHAGEMAGYVEIYPLVDGKTVSIGDTLIYREFRGRGIYTAFLTELSKLMSPEHVLSTVINEKDSLMYLNKTYEESGADEKGLLNGYGPDKCKIGFIYAQGGFPEQKIKVTVDRSGSPQFELISRKTAASADDDVSNGTIPSEDAAFTVQLPEATIFKEKIAVNANGDDIHGVTDVAGKDPEDKSYGKDGKASAETRTTVTSGARSEPGAEIKGNPWYNKYVGLEIPKKPIRRRLNKIRKLSKIIARKLGDRVKESNLRDIDVDEYAETLSLFEKMIKDTDMSPAKLEQYVYNFHFYMNEASNLTKGQYGYYDLGTAHIVQDAFIEIFSKKAEERIKNDPFGFIADIMMRIIAAQAFHDGNHRVADMVMNFILVKLGFPFFMISVKNVFQYYRLFNTKDLQKKILRYKKGKVSVSKGYSTEMQVEFLRHEIDKRVKAKKFGLENEKERTVSAEKEKGAKIPDLPGFSVSDPESDIIGKWGGILAEKFGNKGFTLKEARKAVEGVSAEHVSNISVELLLSQLIGNNIIISDTINNRDVYHFKRERSHEEKNDDAIWHKNKTDLNLPKKRIREELELIKKNAEIIQAGSGRSFETSILLGPSWLSQFMVSVETQIKLMDIFEETVKDPDMTPDKLLGYILKFHSHMGEDEEQAPEDIFFGWEDNEKEEKLAEFKTILKRLFSSEAQVRIENDPVEYAAEIFNEIFTLHPFWNGNHRCAGFVMNYILVKNGKPYWFPTRNNIADYYALFPPLSKKEYRFDEKIKFFREGINEPLTIAAGAEGENAERIPTDTSDFSKITDINDIVPEEEISEKTRISWTSENIVKNAEWAVPRLVEALMEAAPDVKNEKVVLMIDTDLAGISEENAAEKINDLICLFERINKQKDNRELNGFLKNIEIIAKSGEIIAERAKNITDKGSISPENIIAITTSSNSGKISAITGIHVTAIEGFRKDEYLPLPEVMLFAFGRYLKWNEKMLLRCYNSIPTAVSIDDLDETMRKTLLSGEVKTVVIQMIPNAVEFREGEMVDTYARIEKILKNA